MIPLMLFLDSASVDDAARAARLPFVGGLSFNPSLLACALGRNTVTPDEFDMHVRRLAETLPGTLFIQPVSQSTDGIVGDAVRLRRCVDAARLVVKIPFSEDGLRATAQLRKEGMITCTTSIFSTLQAYVAATSGADWIAPYCNRITQAGGDGVATVRAMGEMFRCNGLSCQMLVASVKSRDEMEALAGTGARHITVGLALLEEAAKHAASAAANARFQSEMYYEDGGNG